MKEGKSSHFENEFHRCNKYLCECTEFPKVSLLGVDSPWGDCTFIPTDWGS